MRGRVVWLHTQVQSDQWATGASLAPGTQSWSICMEMAVKSSRSTQSSGKDGLLKRKACSHAWGRRMH